MADRYDFWTHGITAILHDPRPAAQGGPVQFLERAGHGTILEQEGNTSNWLFLAIPTPTVLDDETNIFLQKLAFSFKTNDNAVIDRFQVWIGGISILPDTTLPEFPRNSDRTQPIDIADVNLSAISSRAEGRFAGVALGLRVRFLPRDPDDPGDPRGRVWIYGAGAQFSY